MRSILMQRIVAPLLCIYYITYRLTGALSNKGVKQGSDRGGKGGGGASGSGGSQTKGEAEAAEGAAGALGLGSNAPSQGAKGHPVKWIGGGGRGVAGVGGGGAFGRSAAAR